MPGPRFSQTMSACGSDPAPAGGPGRTGSRWPRSACPGCCAQRWPHLLAVLLRHRGRGAPPRVAPADLFDLDDLAPRRAMSWVANGRACICSRASTRTPSRGRPNRRASRSRCHPVAYISPTVVDVLLCGEGMVAVARKGGTRPEVTGGAGREPAPARPTATTPWPAGSTSKGLMSSSSIWSPTSKARRWKRMRTSTRASMSPAGRPRTPVQERGPLDPDHGAAARFPGERGHPEGDVLEDLGEDAAADEQDPWARRGTCWLSPMMASATAPATTG